MSKNMLFEHQRTLNTRATVVKRITLNNIQDLNQKLLKNTVLNDLTFSCCSSEDGRNMIQIPNLVISLPAQLHQQGIFMS